MESSAYYKQKIDEFTALKNQLTGLLAPIETCSSSVAKSRSYLDNIIICGNPIDKEVISGTIEPTVKNMSSIVQTLISECQTKINEYTDLYNKALKKEQEEAERAARRANRWWSKWI